MYDSLNGNIDEFRLLHILPGSPGSQIRCELTKASLLDPPSYEALSYTWGKETSRTEIKVNDVFISPSQNLHDALKHLRYNHAPRVLWVDAICIDQGNVKEKGRHVSKMKHIYETAFRVVVWLGLESPTSTSAIEMLDRVGRVYEETGFLKPILSYSYDENHVKKIAELLTVYVGEPKRDSPWVISLSELLKRNWWQRVWVQQEFATAKQALFVCGAHTLNADYLIAILHSFNLFSDYRSLTVETNLFPSAAFKISNLRTSFQNNFSTDHVATVVIYHGAAPMEATDPRDRIYGILGLTNDTIGVNPNYELSVEEVYSSFVKSVIENLPSADPRRLSLLQQCQTPAQKQYKHLPSWVRDWTRPSGRLVATINPYRPPLFTAAGSNEPQLGSEPDSLAFGLYHLPVVAKRVGMLRLPGPTVSLPRGSPILFEQDQRSELARFFSRKVHDLSQFLIRESLCQNDTDMKDGVALAPIFRLLSFDKEFDLSASDTRATQDTLDRFSQLFNAFKETPSGLEEFSDLAQSLSQLQKYSHDLTILERGIVGRDLFICEEEDNNTTDSGRQQRYAAIVPDSAQAGDTIWAIWGTEIPFVLRKSGEHTWTIIGDAYVDGIMDGQLAQSPKVQWERLVLD